MKMSAPGTHELQRAATALLVIGQLGVRPKASRFDPCEDQPSIP
jgi:hypothetical protein